MENVINGGWCLDQKENQNCAKHDSEDIRNVYTSCCGKTLDPNYKNVLKNLKSSWTALTEDPQISMSWPNKVHYIVDHFQDYFEDPLVNGEALGNTTDQLIEHMHSEIDKIMKIGGYWVNDAEKCGKISIMRS